MVAGSSGGWDSRVSRSRRSEEDGGRGETFTCTEPRAPNDQNSYYVIVIPSHADLIRTHWSRLPNLETATAADIMHALRLMPASAASP